MTPREIVRRMQLVYKADSTVIGKGDYTERQLMLGLIVGIASAKTLMEEMQIAKYVIKHLGDVAAADSAVCQIVALVCRNMQSAREHLPIQMAEFLHMGVLALAKKGVSIYESPIRRIH